MTPLTPQILVRYPENKNSIELAPLNVATKNQMPRKNSQSSTKMYMNTNNENKNLNNTENLTTLQIPLNNLTQTTSTNFPYLPLRLFPRGSISSRRGSTAHVPDLMRSGSNFTNLFHSFESKDSTSIG